MVKFSDLRKFTRHLEILNLTPSILWREADAPHQVIKAWIGAQEIKAGIDLEIGESLAMRFIGFFQPCKRLVLLAQAGIDERYFVFPYAVFAHMLFQSRNSLARRIYLARAGVSIA